MKVRIITTLSNTAVYATAETCTNQPVGSNKLSRPPNHNNSGYHQDISLEPRVKRFGPAHSILPYGKHISVHVKLVYSKAFWSPEDALEQACKNMYLWSSKKQPEQFIHASLFRLYFNSSITSYKFFSSLTYALYFKQTPTNISLLTQLLVFFLKTMYFF